MNRRRLITLALVALAALAPSQRAPAQQDGAPQIERVPQPIVDLLADYARAYRERDADLLAATIGPDILERERKAFANARAVPFTSYVIDATTQFSGNLAGPRVRTSYPGLEVLTYHVIEQTRIGSETGTFVEDGAFTFARAEDREAYDGWRLVSKTDLDVLGFFSPYHLWDEAEVVVLRSERFTLLTHPDVADVLRPVLDVAERAYDRAADFWPGPQDDHYVIIAPSTTAELGRIMHETVDLTKFVAFVAAGAERDNGWEPTGPRMFIHLSHLRTYPPAAQTEIIAHELIHAVTRDVSGPHIPIFVEEGLANLGGGTGGRASRASQRPPGDTFPTQDRFTTGPVRDIQTSYDQAQVAIEVLVAKAGREGLAKFYETLGAARVVPGTEAYHLRAAVQKSVGWSYDEWLHAWQERLR